MFPKPPKKTVNVVTELPPVSLESVPLSDCLHPASINFLNACTYVAGYLLYKVPISCDTCKKSYILPFVPQNHSKYILLNERRYTDRHNLVIPSECFLDFVEKLCRYFSCNFPPCKYMTSIMSRLINGIIHTIPSNCNSLECHEKLKCIVRLFFRVKIHHSLRKFNISSVHENVKRRNRKVLKLMNL